MKQAAPARSPTPPSNGSILNGRRGGGAGRGGNQRHRNQNSRSASSPISNPATASTAQHTIRIAPSGNRHHAASPISAAGIVTASEPSVAPTKASAGMGVRAASAKVTNCVRSPIPSASKASSPVANAPSRESRSEEHTSELQSLMRNSYDVCCLKKKNN